MIAAATELADNDGFEDNKEESASISSVFWSKSLWFIELKLFELFSGLLTS